MSSLSSFSREGLVRGSVGLFWFQGWEDRPAGSTPGEVAVIVRSGRCGAIGFPVPMPDVVSEGVEGEVLALPVALRCFPFEGDPDVELASWRWEAVVLAPVEALGVEARAYMQNGRAREEAPVLAMVSGIAPDLETAKCGAVAALGNLGGVVELTVEGWVLGRGVF